MVFQSMIEFHFETKKIKSLVLFCGVVLKLLSFYIEISLPAVLAVCISLENYSLYLDFLIYLHTTLQSSFLKNSSSSVSVVMVISPLSFLILCICDFFFLFLYS